MPEMTNMKLPPRKEKTADCAPCAMPQEQYPYGLRLYLDKEQLEQLGIDKLPETGAEIMISAKAAVVSVNESADDSGSGKNVRRSVGLQITDMLVKAPQSDMKTEDVFYNPAKKAS